MFHYSVPQNVFNKTLGKQMTQEKLFYGQIYMENVTMFSQSDKCEINMPKQVLFNVSPMNWTVTMQHIALINILVIHWSVKQTLENDVQQRFEKLLLLSLGYDILKYN